MVKRPIVRYHGGKWLLAPWIISHFPDHRVYVEPFGGGGSVLLRKQRSYAEVYNDLDDEIVNVFRVARDHGACLKELLHLTPFARTEFLEAYEPTDDPVERARRTIIRTFMGFGSDGMSSKHKTGFRANSNRSGTTPAHDWKNYAEVFDLLIERLRGVIIENRDAKQVMETHDQKDALHYVDPPYVFSTRSEKGAGEYKHEMDDDEHRALAAFLSTLKGTVIVSGYPSDLYAGLYEGWHVEEKQALADGALARREVLWMNRKPEGRFSW